MNGVWMDVWMNEWMDGGTDREEVKREPLTPPNVDKATEMGMSHDITPNSFSPNVWEKATEW